MTATKEMAAPKRRQGALGAHSLDAFTFAAPDLAVAEAFYRDFGLNVRHENGGLGLYTEGHAHRWGSVIEGPKKKLHHLTFGIFDDDLSAITQRLQKLAVKRLDPPRGMESNGLWFQDPEQTLVEVRVAEKSSLSTKPVPARIEPPPGKGAAPKRSQAGAVRPERLSHVLLFTANLDAQIDFYSRVLGLRLSDRSRDVIGFLHAPHGSDHHVIAFAKSDGPGLHHSSWAVNSVHEVGLGAGLMAERGHAAGWGVGRHVLGSNYFYYVRDPWGGYAEYSHDIDFVPADVEWTPDDHAPEDSFYIWGPAVPTDFVVNYELR